MKQIFYVIRKAIKNYSYKSVFKNEHHFTTFLKKE